MKYIRKILSALIICLFCTTGVINTSLCETNLPFGEIGEYGNWIIPENMETYRDSISSDVNEFQQNFYENVKNPGFVPIETKCPNHPKDRLNLFCLDEKGKNIILFNILY